MVEQSTLLMRPDTDCLRTPVFGKLRMPTNTVAKISTSAHFCE